MVNNAVITNGTYRITEFTVVIRMTRNALLFVWFSSSLFFPLSPGPDCFRALRTATRQNNWMKMTSVSFTVKNHACASLLFEAELYMQTKQEPRLMIQAAVQITLYLLVCRCFRCGEDQCRIIHIICVF